MDAEKVRQLLVELARETQVDLSTQAGDSKKMERERVGLLSNDLNNIIQEISGYLDLMGNSSPEAREKIPNFVDAAKRSIGRATQISRQLSMYSQTGILETPRAPLANIKAPPVESLKQKEKGDSKEAESRLIAERKISNPNGKGPLIMVVDDEPDNCNLLDVILTSEDYRVISAFNGEEAFSLFRQYQGQISLVLLDYIMPEMNGVDTFKALKLLESSVKAYIISGHYESDVIRELLSQGLLGFLSKPFTAEHLLTRVRDALNPLPVMEE